MYDLVVFNDNRFDNFEKVEHILCAFEVPTETIYTIEAWEGISAFTAEFCKWYIELRLGLNVDCDIEG